MVRVPLSAAADAWGLLRDPSSSASSSAAAARVRLSLAPVAPAAGPVLLFAAAADPDAVAAVRVLTALLKNDLLRYELHPVTGYSDLQAKFAVLARTVAPRAVLCVNCGAGVDLEAVLDGSPADAHDKKGRQPDDGLSDVRLFVMDSHRPFHLKNLRSERVVLFDDVDAADEAELPISLDIEDRWGKVPDDDESESDEDEDEDDDDDDDAGSVRSRGSVSESASESDLSDFIDDGDPHAPPDAAANDASGNATADDDDADADADGHVGDNANGDAEERPARLKTRRRDKASRAEEAYLNELQNDDVKFDTEANADDSDDEQVIRKGTKRRREQQLDEQRRKKRQARRRAVHSRAEEQERRRLRDYYSNATFATSSACISHSIAKVMRRSTQDTLWMAIVGITSQFVTSIIPNAVYDSQNAFCKQEVGALNVAPAAGEGETSSVQNVGYVPSCSGGAVQRIAHTIELRLDLLRHWSLYDSLMCSSYSATRMATWRQTGKRRMLELLATLGIPLKESQQMWCYMKQKNKVVLEESFGEAITRFDLGEGIQYESFVRSVPGHRGDISASDFVHALTALLEVNERHGERHGKGSTLLDRFWKAYDACDLRQVNLLKDGLDMAMFVQRLTAHVAGDIIDRRKFVPSGPFRYVFLRDQQHKELLSQPLLLRRLALFVNSALLRQGAREKPFIVLAPDSVRGVWLAVASTGVSQRNDFGQRFQRAAEKNGSTVTYSGFDSSICEIRDGQEIEFVRFLHDVL